MNISFGLKNFRRFQELPMMDLGGINIFVGKNNSGKSTAIKALILLLKNISESKSEHLFDRTNKHILSPLMTNLYFTFESVEHLFLGNFEDLINKYGNDKEITFSYCNKGIVYEFVFSYDRHKRPVIVRSSIDYQDLKHRDIRIHFDYVFSYEPFKCEVRCSYNFDEDFINEKLVYLKQLLIEYKKKKQEEQTTIADILTLGIGRIYNRISLEKAKELCKSWKKILKEPEGSLDVTMYPKDYNPSLKDTNNTSIELALEDYLDNINNELEKNFTVPTIHYIEAHNASHNILLNKENKDNYLAQTIARYDDNNQPNKKFVEKWMKELEIGQSFKIEDVDGEAYRVNIINNGVSMPLAHKGTGSIQLFILLLRIATAMNNSKDELIIVEEPEQNLHPSMQSRLADLFYEVWSLSKGKVNFVVETHSEYLVRNMQVIVAKHRQETGDSTDDINEKFKVYYFRDSDEEDLTKGPSGVYYSLEFLADGHFRNRFESGFSDEATSLYKKLLLQ